MARPVIGIDIGSRNIKGVKVVPRKKILEVDSFAMFSLPQDSIEKGEIVDDKIVSATISELIRELRAGRCRIVTAISGELATVRNIKMPKMEKEEIRDALPWELEDYLSFSTDKAVLDFVIENEEQHAEGEEISIRAVAAPREQVKKYVDVFEEAGVKPEIVNLQAFGLYQAIKLAGLEQEKLALADIGASSTELILVNGGIIEQHRNLTIGGNSFTRALSESFSLSLDEAERLKVQKADEEDYDGEMDLAFGALADEFSRSLSHFQIQHRGEEIEQLYLCGGGALTLGLLPVIRRKLDISISFLDVARHIEPGRNLDLHSFTENQSQLMVALGLALSEVKK